MFWQRLKAGEGVGELHSGKKGRLQVCPDLNSRHGEAGGGLTRNEISYLNGQGNIISFL